MNFPKLFAWLALIIFGLIAVIALFKKLTRDPTPVESPNQMIEIVLSDQNRTFVPVEEPLKKVTIPSSVPPMIPLAPPPAPQKENESTVVLPDADRINELFNTNDPRLPIVETLSYKSHTTWLKGRPAWLADYASHFNTSRHFIARSLNGKPDYLKQEIGEGDRFNVFKEGKKIEFYLIVDASRCKMWFYYLDLDTHQKVLLKTYPLCLGRPDESKASGLLTPLGTYTLGNRVVVFKPKMMGTHQGKNKELITVFGTRWIPFENEIGVCTAPAKGFGVHGTPWRSNDQGELVDGSEGIGHYQSDGCIRLSTQDVEELYAIIVTKPTTIEIVKDFYESKLFDRYPEK